MSHKYYYKSHEISAHWSRKSVGTELSEYLEFMQEAGWEVVKIINTTIRDELAFIVIVRIIDNNESKSKVKRFVDKIMNSMDKED